MVMRDSRHTWDAAEFFNAQLVSMRKRALPADEEQRIVQQSSITAHVTRPLRAHDADMRQQAWEMRARKMLPRGTTWLPCDEI